MARKMKDSGIEWIGVIHPCYQVVRLKHLLRGSLMYGANESGISYDETLPRYIRITDITMDGKLKQEGKLSLSDDTAEGYLLSDNDILFARSGATVGKAFIYKASYGKAAFAGYLIKASTNEKVSADYLFFYTQSSIYEEWKKQIFVQATIQNIGADRYCELPVVLPPLAQQNRIVDVLSMKCAEIDAVIERTKATIEEYKKLKQAVITEAVTKGVRGPRKMKDSGIEWVADIVDAWKMSRIGLHYSIVLGKMLCDKQLTEEYTLEPYFCAANIHFDGVSQEQLKQMWFSPAEKISYRVQNGDLLVVEGGAGAGGAAIVEILKQETFVQNSVMIVRGLSGQTNRYLRYWIECLVKKGCVEVVCNKATIPHFTKDKLATMPVPVVPVDEMEEIADYLDQKCASLDTLVAGKTALLTEMESYKKSLIYEYVTGKKEVDEELM